eukprot:403360710
MLGKRARNQLEKKNENQPVQKQVVNQKQQQQSKQTLNKEKKIQPQNKQKDQISNRSVQNEETKGKDLVKNKRQQKPQLTKNIPQVKNSIPNIQFYASVNDTSSDEDGLNPMLKRYVGLQKIETHQKEQENLKLKEQQKVLQNQTQIQEDQMKQNRVQMQLNRSSFGIDREMLFLNNLKFKAYTFPPFFDFNNPKSGLKVHYSTSLKRLVTLKDLGQQQNIVIIKPIDLTQEKLQFPILQAELAEVANTLVIRGLDVNMKVLLMKLEDESGPIPQLKVKIYWHNWAGDFKLVEVTFRKSNEEELLRDQNEFKFDKTQSKLEIHSVQNLSINLWCDLIENDQFLDIIDDKGNKQLYLLYDKDQDRFKVKQECIWLVKDKIRAKKYQKRISLIHIEKREMNKDVQRKQKYVDQDAQLFIVDENEVAEIPLEHKYHGLLKDIKVINHTMIQNDASKTESHSIDMLFCYQNFHIERVTVFYDINVKNEQYPSGMFCFFEAIDSKIDRQLIYPSQLSDSSAQKIVKFYNYIKPNVKIYKDRYLMFQDALNFLQVYDLTQRKYVMKKELPLYHDIDDMIGNRGQPILLMYSDEKESESIFDIFL